MHGTCPVDLSHIHVVILALYYGSGQVTESYIYDPGHPDIASLYTCRVRTFETWDNQQIPQGYYTFRKSHKMDSAYHQ